MGPQIAKRVARWHVSRSDCTPYPSGYADSTWRQHFEYDRKRMVGRTRVRPEDAYKVDAIVEFLRKPS